MFTQWSLDVHKLKQRISYFANSRMHTNKWRWPLRTRYLASCVPPQALSSVHPQRQSPEVVARRSVLVPTGRMLLCTQTAKHCLFALLAGCPARARVRRRDGRATRDAAERRRRPLPGGSAAERKPLKLHSNTLAETWRDQQNSLSVKASFRSIHGPLKTSCTTVSSP